MYQTHKTYIRAEMKMSDLIDENPFLLLLLEHLEIDFIVNDKNVEQISRENNVPLPVFLMLCNIYNGFYPEKVEIDDPKDLAVILNFLKNSHRFYKNDKYPEIRAAIEAMRKKHESKDVALIEQFFNVYFKEVLEHLDYEDEVAFPYFNKLIENDPGSLQTLYSVKEYREHHSDIETKLTDLKNLMLRHITLKNDLSSRRKFLFSLFELEFDLNIHSMIEELILLPLVDKMEIKMQHE